MTALKDRLFQAFARRYPTEKVGENAWGALWRIAFYAIGPSEPFVMRTQHYRLWAHPKKGPLSHAVIRRGAWERTLTDQFRRCLRPGMLVVDAGANFGHFGMVAADCVGPEGQVFSFEPHGPTFAMLEANAALNGFPHLRTVRAALSDSDGEAVLVTDSANAGGHSLDAGNVGMAGNESVVPVRTLDSYLAEHAPGRRLGMLKIDVQGFEAQLLEGAAGVIARDRPAVVVVVSPAMIERVGRTTAAMLRPFADAGYTAIMVEDSQGKARKASFAELEAHFAANAGRHTDLVLIPPA
jgi:FkbM family methyltransferase